MDENQKQRLEIVRGINLAQNNLVTNRLIDVKDDLIALTDKGKKEAIAKFASLSDTDRILLSLYICGLELDRYHEEIPTE